jgi:hypothetical protein
LHKKGLSPNTFYARNSLGLGIKKRLGFRQLYDSVDK